MTVPQHRAAATVSPKVVASTVGAFAGPIVLAAGLAAVGAIIDQPALLDAVPDLVRVPLLAALGAAAAALAGYRQRDALRDLGAAQLPTTPDPEAR